MSFIDSLPMPSFDTGDTVRAKDESKRNLMYRTYYICENNKNLFLIDSKNKLFGNTNYYALEREAINCKMLLTEKSHNEIKINKDENN